MIITIIFTRLLKTKVWAIIEYWGDIDEPASTVIPLVLILLVGGGLYLAIKLSLKGTYKLYVSLILMGLVALMAPLTVRTSLTASYINSDIQLR